MVSPTPPPLLTLSSLLLLVLLLCSSSIVNSSSKSNPPTKIGEGYRLISIEESPDGGLVGHLVVIKKNNVYGPDIPHLQLFVKYVIPYYSSSGSLIFENAPLSCLMFLEFCTGMRRRIDWGSISLMHRSRGGRYRTVYCQGSNHRH